jgi:hypothetical protein
MVTDLTRTILTRRRLIPDSTLLDCLELAEYLGPRIRAGLTPQLTTAELEQRWQCDQSTVSRRLGALRQYRLIGALLHPGPGAYWEVHRVGPVV